MLTHRSIVANLLQIDSAGHYVHERDTTVAFLPFFHIYGITAIALLGLWSGATLVVMAKFDFERYLSLVERHRALLHVVPPVVLALAKHPAVAGRDFSSIRKLFCGAAPLGADVSEQCARRIGCVLQQGYGMTEASPAAHVTADDAANVKHGSIGRPVASTEARVVDLETGLDVAPGENGEILDSWPASDARLSQPPRRECVAPYKKIRRLDFVDTVPKSASGKILRRLLRDRP